MLAKKNDVQHVGVSIMLKLKIDAHAKLLHALKCWEAGKQWGFGDGMYLRRKLIVSRSIDEILSGQTMFTKCFVV